MVEHTGYRRAIISRNPPLIDEDGYDIDSDDDEERIQEAIAAAAEADPYSSIHLERMPIHNRFMRRLWLADPAVYRAPRTPNCCH